MCKTKFSQKILLLLCVCICVCIGSYGIMAYIMDTDSIVNEFKNGGVKTEIEETFEEPDELIGGVSFTKNVKIKNIGESDCYVRLKVEYSINQIADYCTLDINTTDWIYNSSDGYYYYKNELLQGKTTPSLFTKVTLSSSIPEDYLEAFDIYVYQEGCQSEGFGNYKSAWNSHLANTN